MNKYSEIIKYITKEMNKRKEGADDIYIMGLCHAVQTIALNDLDISRLEYTQIYENMQGIIDFIIEHI